MMDYLDQSFRTQVRKAVEAEIGTLTAAVAEGKAANYEQYQFYCGQLAAYRSVLLEMKEIGEKLYADADEEA